MRQRSADGCVAGATGLPTWGPAMDWNIQCDREAAITVLGAVDEPTLVTLPATMHAHLRAAHLGRLESSGLIGRLLARQGKAHGVEHDMAAMGSAHAGRPDDLLNFQYDPVACAVARGWGGVERELIALSPITERGVLHFERAEDGPLVDVITAVDGSAFSEVWLVAVEEADRRS